MWNVLECILEEEILAIYVTNKYEIAAHKRTSMTEKGHTIHDKKHLKNVLDEQQRRQVLNGKKQTDRQ